MAVSELELDVVERSHDNSFEKSTSILPQRRLLEPSAPIYDVIQEGGLDDVGNDGMFPRARE
ncbi:MAG: hypothetical protein JWO86_649 [Myxococcaceae bacterium]|nr:hypothetical protein [Myxococcaceae bacterium]